MPRRFPLNARLRAAALCAAPLVALAGPPAAAQSPMLCSKPLQPLCSTDVQDFADEAEKQRCLVDMDGYLEELRAYRDCLEQAMEGAAEALGQAEGFKGCLEQGREDCGLDNDDKL